MVRICQNCTFIDRVTVSRQKLLRAGHFFNNLTFTANIYFDFMVIMYLIGGNFG